MNFVSFFKCFLLKFSGTQVELVMDALALTARSPKKRILLRFDDGPGLSQDSFVDGPSAITSGTDEEAVDGPMFVSDTNNNRVALVDLDKSIGNPSDASNASKLLDLDSSASILEELEQFAKEFKEMRIKRGFTQMEVATLLAVINPNVSQSTVSRFESMGLSFTNIVNLKPYFEVFKIKIAKDMAERKTLTDKDDDRGGFFDFSFDDDDIKPPPPKMKRFKRTELSPQIHRSFEKCFLANPRPSPEEVQVISEYCQIESRVVRVWFCNRRRKEADKERDAE